MSIKSQFAVAVVNEIDLTKTAVTFGTAATTSSILNCMGTCPTGIFIPSGWSTSSISFKVCKTPDGTFVALTNFDGTAYAVSGGASTFIPLQPAMFNSVLYIQLVSSVAQTSKTVDFALAPVFQGIHN